MKLHYRILQLVFKLKYLISPFEPSQTGVFSSHTARGLPRAGDPVAADPSVEYGNPAVQSGPVPRGREVVWAGNELPAAPGLPAGQLSDSGNATLQLFEHSTQGDGCHFHILLSSSQVCKRVFFLSPHSEM